MSETELPPEGGARRRPAATPNESALLVNPLDPRHIIGVGETAGPDGAPVLAARVTFDGAQWRDSPPMPMEWGWERLSGPVLAMDARGTLHVAALAVGAPGSRAGLALYRSVDGGMSWSRPRVILEQPGECSYSLATDMNTGSAFCGSIYLAADADSTLFFARSRDGEAWTANGDSGSPPLTPGLCLNPEVLVDNGGGVHIVWMTGSRNRSVLSLHSSDGGSSFGEPVSVACGIVDACDWLPETITATCLAPDGMALCAWADYREGRSRIYCRRSNDSGRTWMGPSAGEPLEPEVPLDQHQFQPHLLVTPTGEICCAFYEYGPKPPDDVPLVELVMAVSYDRGATFKGRMTLSEKPWNPAVDEPLSRSATKGALAGLFLG